MTDENLKIVNFAFEQSCYDSIDDRYRLIQDGKNYKISYYWIYKLCSEMISGAISYEEFNNEILSIIKNWKRKYYPTPRDSICDGLCWKLNLKLSNGKYVYYSGHHETPENYDDLLIFLEKYFK